MSGASIGQGYGHPLPVAQGEIASAAQVVPECALQNVAYLYDGSFEGLLTAVFTAYERHEDPEDIVTEREYRPRFDQSVLVVETDYAKALRVKSGIERAAGIGHFRAVLSASLCDDYDRGVAILRFVRMVMARGRCLGNLADPVVARIARLQGRAGDEAEKMRQFVRFEHLENGVWFARCNPNVSVLPLVVEHFAARFNDQQFVIYDENHELSIIYDGVSWQLVSGPLGKVAQATEHDKVMQEAWKCFYDSLSIDARYNPELRRHFMPVRFWKNLTEMKPHEGVKLRSMR